MPLVLALLGLCALSSAYSCGGNTTAAKVVADMGVSLTGKQVLITGGDSGLGLATAVALATANATLFIGSLSPATHGAAAAATILNATGKTVTLLALDLSSFESIRECAAAFHERSASLDVLINDAGIDHDPPSLPPMTEDGYERVFEVNYLGAFLLTSLLRPALAAASGRVINVASAAAFDACEWAAAPSDCAALSELPPPVRGTGNNSLGAPISNYGLTKLLQVEHAAELAARSGLAFSLHPGFVDTPMTRALDPKTKRKWCRFQSGPCPLTTDEGASTQTFLAAAPEQMLAGSNGAYYTQCQPVAPPQYDKASQAALFDASLEWVGSGRYLLRR